MVEHIQRKEVGAVGVLLYYPNKMIQHAGVIVGIGGRAGHPYKLHYSWNPGHFFRPAIIQNLSAITGACLMTRRDVFREIGGFDQIFPNILGDIDLCLKIRKLGYLIVYTPYAELYHYENMSGGSSNGNVAALSKAVTNFQNKWKNILDEGDPYYNPNLTRTKEDFSLRV